MRIIDSDETEEDITEFDKVMAAYHDGFITLNELRDALEEITIPDLDGA